MEPNDIEQRVFALTIDISTMTLATCANNVPWATDVYFANMGYDFLFFSSKNSRHCKNLASNRACSVTIHPRVKSWHDISGIQVEGTVESIDDTSHLASALTAYFKKFSFAEAVLSDLNSLPNRLSTVGLYKVITNKIYYLDNNLGFGARFVCNVENGRRISNFEKAS